MVTTSNLNRLVTYTGLRPKSEFFKRKNSFKGEMHFVTGLEEYNCIPQYQYCNNIVGLTIGAFTKCLHNKIFDK